MLAGMRKLGTILGFCLGDAAALEAGATELGGALPHGRLHVPQGIKPGAGAGSPWRVSVRCWCAPPPPPLAERNLAGTW